MTSILVLLQKVEVQEDKAKVEAIGKIIAHFSNSRVFHMVMSNLALNDQFNNANRGPNDHVLIGSGAPGHIRDLITQLRTLNPAVVRVVGFEEQAPLVGKLVGALQDAGIDARPFYASLQVAVLAPTLAM